MNLIVIIGNLGGDAEEKSFNNGASKYWVLNVATTEKWKKDGEVKSHTTWHRCQLFGNYEKLIPYLRKGTCVSIQGLQRNDRYEMKHDGEAVILGNKAIMQTMPFIKVQNINLVGNKPQSSDNQQQAQPQQAQTKTPAAEENDDLPF